MSKTHTKAFKIAQSKHHAKTMVQILYYTQGNGKQKREVALMIRRELLDRTIENEMERYCNEEMEFDEPFIEDIDELHHREIVENPVNERSLQIRHAIEEHLEKRRLRNQLRDLMEDDDNDYEFED